MSALTEPGWPRPIVGGWPIAWVATPDNLGKMNPQRHRRSVQELLCQVCGLGHEPGAAVYFFCNEPRREGWLALAIDDGILHERCARLAAGRCPKLQQLRSDRSLLLLRAKIQDVDLRCEDGEERLGVSDTDCELVDGP